MFAMVVFWGMKKVSRQLMSGGQNAPKSANEFTSIAGPRRWNGTHFKVCIAFLAPLLPRRCSTSIPPPLLPFSPDAGFSFLTDACREPVVRTTGNPDATPTPVAHLASFTLLCASRLLAAAAQARGGILGQWKSGVGAPFALLRTADRSRTPIL